MAAAVTGDVTVDANVTVMWGLTAGGRKATLQKLANRAKQSSAGQRHVFAECVGQAFVSTGAVLIRIGQRWLRCCSLGGLRHRL